MNIVQVHVHIKYCKLSVHGDRLLLLAMYTFLVF